MAGPEHSGRARRSALILANNTAVNYKVPVVDDQGQPVPGVTVTRQRAAR